MSNNDESTSRRFYDPLYDVIILPASEAVVGERGFWKAQSSENKETRAITEALKVIDCYEFNRMNFLRQAELAWLVFPSASHTRFSHALGCLQLADWALESVVVLQKDGSIHSLRDTISELDGWLEAFRMALLLHDIGHMPFSHIIENSLTLRQKYSKRYGDTLELTHQSIARNHIMGFDKTIKFYSEYMKQRFGKGFDSKRLLYHRLKQMTGFDKYRYSEKICFLLGDKSDDALAGIEDEPKRLIRGLRELTSGVIDLPKLDHYARDAHFISVPYGKVQIQSILRHLAFRDVDDSDQMEIFLDGDGVEHAFQNLWARLQLERSAFNNEDCLAYDVMLSSAIEKHWDISVKDGDEYFARFFPYFDDFELLDALQHSEDQSVTALAKRVILREPYSCVGKYRITDQNDMAKNDGNVEPRRYLRNCIDDKAVTHDLDGTNIFLKFDRLFGKYKNGKLDLGRHRWMDMEKIRDRHGNPISQSPDRKKFVEFIHGCEEVAASTFWVFVPNIEMVENAKNMLDDIGCQKLTI